MSRLYMIDDPCQKSACDHDFSCKPQNSHSHAQASTILRMRKIKASRFSKHRHTRTLTRLWNRSQGLDDVMVVNVNEKLPKNKSPYLGYLRHAPITTSKFRKSAVFGSELDPHVHSSASPYVGFIRHAPPSTSTRSRRSTSTSNSNHNHCLAKNKRKENPNHVWDGYLKQYNCSGRLPGGDAEHVAFGRSRDHRRFTANSFCRWFEATPSCGLGLFQFEDMTNNIYSRDAHSIINPLDSLDMLNKLAYWFLFPIANDSTYTFKDSNEIDYLHGISSIVLPFFSSILRKVLTIDFSHSVGTKFGHEGDFDGERQLLRQVSSMSSLPAASHRPQADNKRQDSDEELVANSEENNLFRSISSIDSDEIMSLDHRHLDLEIIMKLPTMTFGDDMSSDDLGSLDTSEGLISIDDNTRNAPQSGGLEWSWIAVPKDLSESSQSIESSLLKAQVQCKYDKCVICLEEFQKGDRLRVLPCEHRFHCGCIDKWLSGSFSDENCVTSLCPICKSAPSVEDNSGPSSIESMLSIGSLVELCDDDSMQSLNQDGSMPSWAFARLGSKISDRK